MKPALRHASLALLLVATAAVAGGALPVRHGSVFVYPDGTQVRAVDPSGRAGMAAPDGSIRYADGTVVQHDGATGDIRLSHGNGSAAETLAGNAPTKGSSGFLVFADGTRLRDADAAGRPGRMMGDGSVAYPDGTRATHDTRSGDTRFVAPDGTARVINLRKGTDRTTRSAAPPKSAVAPTPGAGALLTLPQASLVQPPLAAGKTANAGRAPIDPFAAARR
jgi:hypothetical protein